MVAQVDGADAIGNGSPMLFQVSAALNATMDF
jgi:hypothetical protein